MKKRFNFFLALTILYATFIFYLSSMSSFGDPKAMDGGILGSIFFYLELIFKYPDKVVHMIEYALFGFLLYLTMKNSPYPSFRVHAMLFAIAIGILYGMSDEFHQSFVPGRTASIMDLAADGVGVTLAQTFIFIKDKLCIKPNNPSKSQGQDKLNE